MTAAGDRAPRTGSLFDSPRITTWNVRGFPAGGAPSAPPGAMSTDIAWLACAIVWLQSDVVVLEEVMGDAGDALVELHGELEQRSQTAWSYAVESCDAPTLPHVAILFRHSADVEIVESKSFKLSRSDEPLCAETAPPALAMHLDYHGKALAVVGVDLTEGSDADAYQRRRDSMLRLGYAFLAEDRDVPAVVTGSFGSVGCDGCTPTITSSAEIATLADELSFASLTRAISAVACTQYTDGVATTVDHAAVRIAGTGAAPAARVDGLCAELACAPVQGDALPAFSHLSDHCPVSVDIPLAP